MELPLPLWNCKNEPASQPIAKDVPTYLEKRSSGKLLGYERLIWSRSFAVIRSPALSHSEGEAEQQPSTAF